MKIFTIITLAVLMLHDQTIVAMQALRAKQEKISDPYLVIPAKRAEGQEISMIEPITDEDEKDELFKEIRQEIGDRVGTERARLHLKGSGKAENLLAHFLPNLTALRNKILANNDRVATSNLAKIVDSRSKIALLCYAFEMFLIIDDAASDYAVAEKPQKKKEIWEIVTSVGIKDTMPLNTKGILKIAFDLPMYQEVAGLGQVTTKKELKEMIEAAKKPIKKEYNEIAAKIDMNNLCAAYDFLLKKFNELVSKKEVRYSSQSEIKIDTLVTFGFLYMEINSGGCFRMNKTEREKAKDDLWQKLKYALKTAPDIHYITGDRPDYPGIDWVVTILRQRHDPETRAFINPIFKRR